MYSANKKLYEGVAYNATDLHPVAPMKVHLLVAHAITIKSLVVSVNMDECRQLHQSHGIVGKDPVVDRMLKTIIPTLAAEPATEGSQRILLPSGIKSQT